MKEVLEILNNKETDQSEKITSLKELFNDNKGLEEDKDLNELHKIVFNPAEIDIEKVNHLNNYFERQKLNADALDTIAKDTVDKEEEEAADEVAAAEVEAQRQAAIQAEKDKRAKKSK